MLIIITITTPKIMTIMTFPLNAMILFRPPRTLDKFLPEEGFEKRETVDGALAMTSDDDVAITD